MYLQPGGDQGDQKAERSSWQNCTDRILQNMVSSKQQRMERRRAHKSSNLILSYDVPSCTHMYLRILTMYLWFVYLSMHEAEACYQPHDMYSSYSILNKELTSPIFSFLGSVSDGHFSEHQKWHLWLWWNYCQTIQTSRKTTIDDLFLYQLLISRYLHLSRLFNCSIVIPLRQKSTFVHH